MGKKKLNVLEDMKKHIKKKNEEKNDPEKNLKEKIKQQSKQLKSSIPKVSTGMYNKPDTERPKLDERMREFLRQVSLLTEEDFILEGDSYKNPIIDDAYKIFIKNFIRDKLFLKEGDYGFISKDEEIVREYAEKAWQQRSLFAKIFEVLFTFSKQTKIKNIETFFVMMYNELLNVTSLFKFIGDYLKSSTHYRNFFNRWFFGQNALATLGEQESKEKEKLSDFLTEQEQHDVMKISQNQDLTVTLQQAVDIVLAKRNLLVTLTDEEAEEVMKKLKTLEKEKDELEKTFLELGESKRNKNEKLNETDTKKLKKKLKKVLDKKSPIQIRKDLIYLEYSMREDLSSLSLEELIEKVLQNIPKSFIINYILYDKFFMNMKDISAQIFQLDTEIENMKNILENGKYVEGTKKKSSKLNYEETSYRDRLIIFIRRLELEKLTKDELIVKLKSLCTIDSKQLCDDLEKQGDIDRDLIIHHILKSEFVKQNIKAPLQTVPKNVMKKVLLTLTDNQIDILASYYQIKHPETNSNYSNTLKILKEKYPQEEKSTLAKITKILNLEYEIEKEKTQQLVKGKDAKKFNMAKRVEELKGLDKQEIKQLAKMYGIPRKGKGIEKIIDMILNYELDASKFIDKRDMKKQELIEKIASITEEPKQTYAFLTVEELQAKLEELSINKDGELWKEIERERLYNVLKKLVDVNLPEYENADKWHLDMLRQAIEHVAGPDWKERMKLVNKTSFIRCMEKYTTFSWVPGKVISTWIAMPDEEKPPVEYVFPNKTVRVAQIEQNQKVNKRTWYMANRKFFSIQCNEYKNKREQNGNVLTCFSHTGEKLNFMVGYTISNFNNPDDREGHTTFTLDASNNIQDIFIVQDEMLFRNEILAERRDHQTGFMRIQDILNSAVSDTALDYITEKLSKSLLEIAPLNTDYGITTQVFENGAKIVDHNTFYIQFLVNSLKTDSTQTNKELLEKVADILVYLQIPEAKTFRHNIEMEYYLPDIIGTLSQREKFPEVYEDPEISPVIIEQVDIMIANNTVKLINLMAEELFYFENPITQKPTNIQTYIFINKPIKTRSRLLPCENKMEGVEPEEIVYYTDLETGTTYCFTVDNLHNQINNDDFINHHTGKEFSHTFLDRFKQVYSKQLSESKFLDSKFQAQYGFTVKHLKTHETTFVKRPKIGENLFSLVDEDITRLENYLAEGKRPSSDKEELEESSPEEKTKDICEYCKKHILNDSIKTITYNGESKIIKFCSIKCFEQKDEWVKFSLRKRKDNDIEEKPKKKSKK